jgi:hypothetical protein
MLISIPPHYGEEQMIACLLAEIKAEITNQAKTDTTLKELNADQEHPIEEMLAKMEAKIGASQEKMDAWVTEMRAWRKEMTACQK